MDHVLYNTDSVPLTDQCSSFWCRNTVTDLLLVSASSASDRLRKPSETPGNDPKAIQSILMWTPVCPAGRRCDWLVWWRRAAPRWWNGYHKDCAAPASSQSPEADPWSWSLGKCWTSSSWQSHKRRWERGWVSASGRPRWLWLSDWCQQGSGPGCHTA